MAVRLRLAVLSSRFPYPTEKGDKLRLFHQLKSLSEDYDIYLFTLTDSPIPPPERKEVARYCKDIFIYRESARNREWRVARNLLKPLPAQLHYFYSERIHKQFLKDFFPVNADVIYCQLYRMAPYLRGITAPKILDVMDSFGTIAELYGSGARSFYERWFWRKEHDLIRRYESRYMEEFSNYTVISERDAAKLTLPGDSSVAIIRNGIDVDYFQEYHHRVEIPEYDLAFIGNMEYRPNIEAVRFIREELIPFFEKNKVEIKVLIGGKGADRLRRFVKSHPRLTFHGWYPDIREAYYSARVFIAPLFLGSGMQNKVMEAVASSRSVICSSHVIEAMPMLRDLVYIADRKEDYLNYFLRLKAQSFKSEKQNEALAVLKNELTWQGQNEILKKVIYDTAGSYEWNITQYH